VICLKCFVALLQLQGPVINFTTQIGMTFTKLRVKNVPAMGSEFCILNPWSHDQTFLAWGNVKNSLGVGKNVLVSTASLSILGNAISEGKLKQNTVVFSNNAWAH
jgi:hypothetical protein